MLTGRETVLAFTYDATIQLFSQEGSFLGQRSILAGTGNYLLPDGIPTHLPFLQDLFVSANGFIWAQRGDRHPRPALRGVAEAFGFLRAAWPEEWRGPIHFDLFSPDGGYRGSVVFPELFTPMAVTEDRVYGSIRDELDLQYVVAYAIPRP